MRLVKQEIARRANAEDDCTGHFWESRFTSVVSLDMAATLACMVYVDLNPSRAHLVKDPTKSLFTSIRHRQARTQGVRAVHSFRVVDRRSRAIEVISANRPLPSRRRAR